MKDLLPLIAAALGAIAALAGGWMNDRRQGRAREQAEWAAFQRETILSLQEALNDAATINMRSYDSSKSTAAEELSVANRIEVLVSRLDDQRLADRAARAANAISNLGPRIADEERFDTTVDEFDAVQAALGAKLRALHHRGR